MLSNAIPFSADNRDAAVAWHYGDPLGEQRLLAAGRGTVDLSNRVVFRVTGEDRVGYLNSLTTQKLVAVQAGDSALTLDLSPQGFVLHEIHLFALPDSLLLTVEAETAANLLAYLLRMRFRSKVEVVEVSTEFGSLWQPVADRHSDFPTWVSPFASPGRELLVPRADLDRLVAAEPVGIWAYEAVRAAGLVPRQGAETDHHTLPHEVGWIGSAVHLMKGCYRGQETVSKVERMGQPPRRLELLLLEGREELPPAGTAVFEADREVGRVCTVAQHFELGPIATALVKRTLPRDASLLVAGQAAAIH